MSRSEIDVGLQRIHRCVTILLSPERLPVQALRPASDAEAIGEVRQPDGPDRLAVVVPFAGSR
jgi:hypothetical protein